MSGPESNNCAGLPILPNGYLVQPPVKGTDYHAWSTEPFLFFTDFRKQPVTKTKAGDYATIGEFSYDYQPGTGGSRASTGGRRRDGRLRLDRFSGSARKSRRRGAPIATAKVAVPPALLRGDRSKRAYLAREGHDGHPRRGARAKIPECLVDGPPDLAGAGPF